MQNDEADVASRALRIVRPPLTMHQNGNILGGTFGTAFFHIPDKGAKNKLNEKRHQLPKNELGILFIDLSGVAGGIKDWEPQIEFRNPINHFSAIILFTYFGYLKGFTREVKIILNETSKNLLPQSVINFLNNFENIRVDKRLMDIIEEDL